MKKNARNILKFPIFIFILVIINPTQSQTCDYINTTSSSCPQVLTRTKTQCSLDEHTRKCTCDQPLFINQNGGCSIDCSLFTNTQGNINKNQCVCKENYRFVRQPIFGCAIDCSKIVHALATTSDGMCQCSTLYTFNEEKKQCIFESKTLGLVFGLSTPFIIFLIVLGYCVYTRHKKNKTIKSQKLYIQPSAFISKQESQSYNEVSTSIKPTINSSDTCNICLNDNVNSMMKCGHYYHQKCILNWLSKKSDCPTCRSQDVSQLTIFCSKCYSYTATLKLRNDPTLQQIYKCLDQVKCSVCTKVLQSTE